MITKNYKSIFSYAAALTIGLFMASCDQEENTGLATLTPTAPTLSVATQVSNASLIEDNSVFTFTATLSETQLVDVKLNIFQVDGDATQGSDFEVTGGLVIPAGSLSASGEVKILADDLVEETETVKIQIGDEKTANATIAPVYMEFTILNYTDGDLAIDLHWDMASTTTDNSGEAIDPTDFADMRLLISTTPDNVNVYDGADGGSFESFVLASDTPDGEYYVVADFYDANSDIVRALNLDVTFNQAGVINNQNFSYPSAISNDNICSNNFYVLTKITKSGNSYTIEDVRINNFENQVVTYSGTDAGYDSQVSTGVDCDGMVISGLNAEWMYDFWGEVIEEEGVVHYTVDGSGVVTIASQYIFTTSYSGSLYPYTVSGTGTYDEATGELYIQYYLDQEGFSPSNWAFGNGYQTTPYFEATLTAN